MDCPAILNSIGLGLDIIGAVLIFIYGLPAPVKRGGIKSLDLIEIDENEKRMALFYNRMSAAGLVLLITGFLLQLISNFL